MVYLLERASELPCPAGGGVCVANSSEKGSSAVEIRRNTGYIRQLSRAFVSTRAVLASVRPDQLNAGTPCASWDVRALINHFIGSTRWAATTIGGFDETTDMDYAAGVFLASYDDNIKVALAAFESDGALEKTVTLSGLSSTAPAGAHPADRPSAFLGRSV
jgi:hypothetical protein